VTDGNGVVSRRVRLLDGAAAAASRIGGLDGTRGGMALARQVDELFRLGPATYWGQHRDPIPGELVGPCRTAVYADIWQRAAADVDARIARWGDGYLLIERGSQRVRVHQHIVPIGDPISLRLAGDKVSMHALLSEAGLPVPPWRAVALSDTAGAAGFVAAHGPCVVKPARDTGGGSGVTGCVVRTEDLVAARFVAGRHDPVRLLVEAMVTGTEYRVLVLDGVPIGAIRRRPPTVVGDGRATVARLVAAENERRRRAGGWAGVTAVTLDLDTVLTLRSHGLTLASVPAAGARVQVHSGTSSAGAADTDVVDIDAPAMGGIRTAAAAAARALSARLISVELITDDPAAPLDAGSGAVIEVNTTPGMAQHYLVADPTRVAPVAARVLRTMLDDQRLRATPPVDFTT
jgi:D-alanine-D-alanine ligase-like ATP-grasp enzyme